VNLIVPHGFEPNYTLGFVKGLAANGVQLCVLSSDVEEAALERAGIDQHNCRGSTAPNRSPVDKVLNLLRYQWRLLGQLWRQPGSTVHFTGIFRREFILFEGLWMPLCFRLLSGKYLYTAHNLLPHGSRDSRLHRWIYRYIYALPHVIIVHTPLMKQQLSQQFGVDPQRVVVSSIGLNEEIPLVGLTREAARQRFGLPTGGRLLLCFGKINRYKGVDLLVEAFSRADIPGDVHLLVAGAVMDGAYGGELQSQIMASPRADRIQWLARTIADDEVEACFMAADALVLPYRAIDQSGVLFLGLRFGVPVLATDVGPMREFVGASVGQVADGQDAAALQRLLEQHLNTSPTFDRAEIRRHAAAFGWPVLCQALVPLYEV
jgi:glycosyltransferase involved in cell wall biosynthesis